MEFVMNKITDCTVLHSSLLVIGGLASLHFVSELISKVFWPWFRPLVPSKASRALVPGTWAIVTGATDGIGHAYAVELASKKMNLLLISRTQTKLDGVKKELEAAYDIKVRVLAIDCATLGTDEASQQKVHDALQDIKSDISLLVNNVGMSHSFPQYYNEVPAYEVSLIIDVNVTAMAWMTRTLLPIFISRPTGGVVVNTSSGTASVPCPLLTQYAASKKFVEQFTENLATEYAAVPNLIFQCQIPMLVSSKMSKIRHTSFTVPSASTYAKYAVASIGHGTFCSPYPPHSMQWFLMSVLPSSVSGSIMMTMHKGLRSRAIKKQERMQKTNLHYPNIILTNQVVPSWTSIDDVASRLFLNNMTKLWDYFSKSQLTAEKATTGNNNISQPSSECPIKHSSSEKNPLNHMAPMDPSIETPSKLSTYRVPSNIPKGDFTPEHQQNISSSACPHKDDQNNIKSSSSNNNWIYPSEAQYYNAMKRKGWNPKAHDMKAIVAIHNTVNERGWEEVLKWEALHTKSSEELSQVRLLRFQGKPTELSPKARWKTWLGYSPPFDRHDWFVERPDGTVVRYVIDFYSGQVSGPGSKPLAMHLDVRPALDSIGSAVDRISMNINELF